MKAETEMLVRTALKCDETILPSVREAAISTLNAKTLYGVGRTLTYHEAAKAIGRSLSTVRSLVARGVLKAIKTNEMKRARGISEESVRRMMKGGL